MQKQNIELKHPCLPAREKCCGKLLAKVGQHKTIPEVSKRFSLGLAGLLEQPAGGAADSYKEDGGQESRARGRA